MIRVRTPSRLHFGLMSLPTKHAPTRRHYGGIGLMIDNPGIDIRVEHAEQFSATGPLAERALHFARTFCAHLNIAGEFRIHIESASPEHMGLGTGTQLGLAVVRAIAELTQQPQRAATMLALQIGRGRRSAVGVHGFEQGGFLVEAGKVEEQSISPLVVRQPFPQEWRVLLIFPRDGQGIHGADELGAFADLAHRTYDERTTETMSRLVLLDMLPALLEKNLDTFGEAIYEYNRRAGELFKSSQGGVYANAWIEATVKRLRENGVRGVGQSSWGPAVFAMIAVEEVERIRALVTKIDHASAIVTDGCNCGAVLSTQY